MPVPPVIDRLAPTRRPVDRAIGYQLWRDLLFVHWRVSADALRPLLPDRLNIDTFDGDAWLGIVFFTMRGVRPWWSPPVPGVSNFHETNVRTYVHADGVPGVWFFSLDAARSLAVHVARRRWSLPYFRSAMTLRRENGTVHYTGRRLWPEPAEAEYDVAAEIGRPFTAATQPDTLEHFLVERYILYAGRSNGSVWRGQVHHIPYPLREARVTRLTESLRATAGLPATSDVAHVCFCDGVDAQIFPLRRI